MLLCMLLAALHGGAGRAGYTFVVPEGRHRPSLQQLAEGWTQGIYGLSTADTLRWRVVFHRPEQARRVGGKVCGKTRGWGWPFRRMRYDRLDELVKPAHEQSDRFSFSLGTDSVAIGIYAYRDGRRPYDEALSYADQRQPLARLAYEQPYVLSLEMTADTTTYRVQDSTGADLARGQVEHRGVWGWQVGKLQGVYVGGKDPAPAPVHITMNRTE